MKYTAESIPTADLKESIYKPSWREPGFEPNAVHIMHLPTGLTATHGASDVLICNRIEAMEILVDKLNEALIDPISRHDYLHVQQECIRLKEVVAELTDTKEAGLIDIMTDPGDDCEPHYECIYCHVIQTCNKTIEKGFNHLDTCPVVRGAALVRER